MTLFSEKVLISAKCISGLMPNLIKKFWWALFFTCFLADTLSILHYFWGLPIVPVWMKSWNMKKCSLVYITISSFFFQFDNKEKINLIENQRKSIENSICPIRFGSILKHRKFQYNYGINWFSTNFLSMNIRLGKWEYGGIFSTVLETLEFWLWTSQVP